MKFQPAPTPFTRDDSVSRGVTSYALKTNPQYVQIYRNVWIDSTDVGEVPTPIWAGTNWTREATRLSGLQLLRPDVVGSLWTAARLFGLPVPRRITDSDLHVAGRESSSKINRPGVTLHRHRQIDAVDYFAIPLISVPQLMVEMAPMLYLSELVQMGDAAISKRFTGPTTSVELMRSELGARKRVRSRKKLQQAISLVRYSVDSPMETWLRVWIVNQGLPEPQVHPVITCGLKNVVLHPDLGYPDLKLAIEYEGDHHRTSPGQFAADIERRQLLEAEGWTVLRVSKRTDMDTFGKLLAAYLPKPRRGSR